MEDKYSNLFVVSFADLEPELSRLFSDNHPVDVVTVNELKYKYPKIYKKYFG